MNIFTSPIFSVAGLYLPPPEELNVTITDGQAILHWKSPVDAPTNSEYNVEMGP